MSSSVEDKLKMRKKLQNKWSKSSRKYCIEEQEVQILIEILKVI